MAIKLKVYNQQGASAGEMELPEKIFAVEPRSELIRQVVLSQQSNERQVSAHAKTRSEVRGGGRKPWIQKGTGRARAGSNRSPIWIGGGVTFGPSKDRNFKKKINRKMRQKAIFMALSDKVKEENLAVLDKIELEEFKTRKFAQMVSALETKAWQADEGKKRSVLVVNADNNDKIYCSGRNIEGVKVINLENINVLDLLAHRYLVLTQAGIKKLEETYLKQ
mgnify:CR=1 FL=1